MTGLKWMIGEVAVFQIIELEGGRDYSKYLQGCAAGDDPKYEVALSPFCR